MGTNGLLHVDAMAIEYVHAQFVHNMLDGKLCFHGVAGVIQRRREGCNAHDTGITPITPPSAGLGIP